MAIELFVPKDEKEQRVERFHLLDSIAETAPHIDFQRNNFKFSSLSLAQTISERSRMGDGVCRIIDRMSVDTELPVEVAWEEDNLVLSQHFTDEEEGSFEMIFGDKFDAESVCYLDREGNSGIPDLWPSFTTGVMKLVQNDLVENRKRWKAELKKDAVELHQEVVQIDQFALSETVKIVRRLQEEAYRYGNGEIFVWGSLIGEGNCDHPSSIIAHKKTVELDVAMPASVITSLTRIRSRYDFEYDYSGAHFRKILNYGPGEAVEISYADFGIRVKEMNSHSAGYRVERGLMTVENDFREFMATGKRLREGVLLRAYSDYFQPHFDHSAKADLNQ